MDNNLLMTVKDNSLRECADIVTTDDDNECFWRIVGYVPERTWNIQMMVLLIY